MTETPVDIPNRSVFRAAEVCELAQVQPYVLRTWETEFPDLGVARTPDGPRVYRRADVERVLEIKQLLFEEGLTLAGARRRLSEAGPRPVEDDTPDDLGTFVDGGVVAGIQQVRAGLEAILALLGRPEAARMAAAEESFELEGAKAPARRKASAGARKKTASRK